MPMPTPQNNTPRSPWLLMLCLLLPAGAVLLAFAGVIPWAGGIRELVEIVIAALLIGLAAIWVYANRRARAGPHGNGRDKTAPGDDTTIQVNAASPRVIHLGSHPHDS